jgi:hypothetical protein
VVVFLAYLFGPSRAPANDTGGAGARLAELASAPLAASVRVVYPAVAAPDRARWTGRLLCALATAGAIALTSATLRRLVPAEGALLLAGSAAFASPLWSWTSRADAPAALATLSVAAALWLLVERPALSASAGAAVAAVPLGLALATSFERVAPFDPTLMAAYLVSPGRGIFLFAPIAALAAAATLRGARPRKWAFGGALVVLASLVAIASRPEPWGALGFGPTLLAPLVPLLAVMAAGLSRNWLRAGAILALPAALAHGASVFLAGHTWDERRGIAQHPDAVWDWEDSPWSDLAFGPPRPDPATLRAVDYFLKPGEQQTREGRPLPWLAYGWEKPEPGGTWASARESWIVLATPPGEYVLTLTATAPGRRGQTQQLQVERPGATSLQLSFSRQLWELEPLAIPFEATGNLTVLKLRPAHTWIPGKGDARALSFFLAALQLEPAETRRR